MLIVNITLRRSPAVWGLEQSTQVISSFLGPHSCMSFDVACYVGSIDFLDWIWSLSPRSAADRTNNWSLTNFLRSDLHYHRWQFAKSLRVAASEGNLTVVKWLFEHFSDCTASIKVAAIAKAKGHLIVLQYLWEHRDVSQSERQQGKCSVKFSNNGKEIEWGYEVIQKAVENGQISQGLKHLGDADRISALRCSLEIGDMELAQLLVPKNRGVLDYATGNSHVEVLQLLLNAGYLTCNSELAASALPRAAAQGSLQFIQRICQLHSPLPKRHKLWESYWGVALKQACARGDLPIFQWFVEHPLGSKAYAKIQQEDPCFLQIAAEHDHVYVMQYLYKQGWTDGYDVAMTKAIQKDKFNSVEWLLGHFWPGGYETPGWLVSRLISDRGLEMLQFLHSLDPSILNRAKETNRRPSDEPDIDWYRKDNAVYWAARCGKLEILTWAQANFRQEVSTDSLEVAAQHGHLDVLKYLHTNNPEICTGMAMVLAAENNHLDVLQWLHSNRLRESNTKAMQRAAERGHFDIVKWLYENCPESQTAVAMDKALEIGHIDIVYWLQSRFPDYQIGSSNIKGYPVIWAISSMFFEAILYLHVHHRYVFTPKFRKRLREHILVCSISDSEHVSNWLDEN